MATLKALSEALVRNLDESIGKMIKSCENFISHESKMVVDLPGLKEEGLVFASDDCKKLESKMKKSGPVCKAADLRPKVLPPYQYGYCKEKEPELPMSCPPKIRKRGRGPCCHQEVKQSKGGCRNN